MIELKGPPSGWKIVPFRRMDENREFHFIDFGERLLKFRLVERAASDVRQDSDSTQSYLMNPAFQFGQRFGPTLQRQCAESDKSIRMFSTNCGDAIVENSSKRDAQFRAGIQSLSRESQNLPVDLCLIHGFETLFFVP